MPEIQREKEELIEMFGIHFETLHHFPPLASRILGTLIVDSCDTGLTFEDLVERMSASKSSVSTSLNLLLKIGKINYYTLPGDRKKYFKPSPYTDRHHNYMKKIDFEKKINDKMVSYRQKTISSPKEKMNLENVREYKNHVLEVEGLLLKTIERFKEIENKNKS